MLNFHLSRPGFLFGHFSAKNKYPVIFMRIAHRTHFMSLREACWTPNWTKWVHKVQHRLGSYLFMKHTITAAPQINTEIHPAINRASHQGCSKSQRKNILKLSSILVRYSGDHWSSRHRRSTYFDVKGSLFWMEVQLCSKSLVYP